MNYSKSFSRPRAMANPVRLLAIGDRQDVQNTIHQLCTLGFCDHTDWSRLQPYHDRPGDYFSVMTKWVHRSDS